MQRAVDVSNCHTDRHPNTFRLVLLPFGSGNYQSGLISLWDMLRSYASFFRTAFEQLQSIRHSISSAFEKNAEEKLITRAQVTLDFLADVCSSTDLDATKHLASELLREAHIGMNTTELDAKIASIQSMAKKELIDKKFFYVPADKASYYGNEELCGKSVAQKFKDAVPDIIQAGNCYALELPTACVFHLMRVIPYGMAVLAKKLKVKYGAPIETLDWAALYSQSTKTLRILPSSKEQRNGLTISNTIPKSLPIFTIVKTLGEITYRIAPSVTTCRKRKAFSITLAASWEGLQKGCDGLDVLFMAERDANKEALEQVEKITESDRDNGEDLLESEDLKRQLREAKERLKSESPNPSGK